MTAPGRLPRLLVATAVHGLPRGVRDRWTREHLAELHVLAPAAQLRYGVGALISARALRRATRAPAPTPPSLAPAVALTEGAPNSSADLLGSSTAPPAAAPRPLRCRLGYWHSWRTMRTSDGQRYVACATCRYEPERSWWGNNALGR